MDDLDVELGLNPLDDGFREVNIKRNTFLTVLCILSFIGNGLSMLQGLSLWGLSGFYARFFSILSRSNSGIQNDMNKINEVLRGMSWTAMAIVVGSIFCIIGAVLMWKMKKIGYFLYVIGQVIPILTIFWLGMTISGNLSFAFVYSVIFAIFPIGFIIMYGINAKHLK